VPGEDAGVKSGPIVLCSSCGAKVRRRTAWQRFSLLRHLGTPGGGRQRTLAGRGEDVYFCNSCARQEDYKVHGLVDTASLFGDER
jgi:hypothetical protein